MSSDHTKNTLFVCGQFVVTFLSDCISPPCCACLTDTALLCHHVHCRYTIPVVLCVCCVCVVCVCVTLCYSHVTVELCDILHIYCTIEFEDKKNMLVYKVNTANVTANSVS